MRRLQLTLAVLITAGVTLAAAAVGPDPVGTAQLKPGAADIQRALAAVRADPNLTPERTVKMLRWNTAPNRQSGVPAWLRAILRWLAGFIAWLNESTRAVWWLVVAALVGVLVVFLVRLIRSRSPSVVLVEKFVAPTHVQDMDIRPETLPADIGAAARAMWDRGDCRGALALLYRGLLSRLAHIHRVPIRDSTTEGDCLALSAIHLPSARHEYASRLVRVWQRAVYAGENIPADTVHVLCSEFGPVLDGPRELDAAASGVQS